MTTSRIPNLTGNPTLSLPNITTVIGNGAISAANSSYPVTASQDLDSLSSFLPPSPSIGAPFSNSSSTSASFLAANSSLPADLESALADLNVTLPSPLPHWLLDAGCLSASLAADSLRDCVCAHPNLTVSQFLQWRCVPPEPPEDVAFTVIVWVSFTILFVAGLLGNGLVCYVVYAAPRMRTVTNLLIANMAAGDLLMTALCMPPTVLYVVLLRYWPLGDALCRLVSFAQPVSVYVSAYTLVAIAADRYRAIVYPLVPRGSRRRARLAIAVVWTLAAATSVPAAVTSRTFVPQDPWYMMHQRRVCQEVSDAPEAA